MNSPAWVLADLPSRLSRRAFSMVRLSGIVVLHGNHPTNAPAMRLIQGLLRHADLMLQDDLAPRARRVEHGQAHLERRRRPGSVMERRAIVHHRVIKLIDHFYARDRWWRQRFELRRAVLMNHDPVRQRPQIGAVATHDEGSKMLMEA